MQKIAEPFSQPASHTSHPTSRRDFLKLGASAVALKFSNFPAGAEDRPNPQNRVAYDVFVYGSTPAGVAAASEAAKRGCKVLLACPQKHPGGMQASGLATLDTGGRRDLFKGFMDEFTGRISREYVRLLGPKGRDGISGFEPCVAEKVCEDILGEQSERLQFYRAHHLLEARVANGRVQAVTLLTPKGEKLNVSARTFIDCTYEGDLAAAAKVPYRVGRESREEYGESKAGIHFMNTHTGQQIMTPDTGDASMAIQAYCARSIFTDDPDHRIPIEKPETYEQHLQDYLPMLQDFEHRRVTTWGMGHAIPRRKFEVNGKIDAGTSINCPGLSWEWPEASRFRREKLAKFHVDHVAGLMWFLQNHPGVPENISRTVRVLGLHDGEFNDNGHWPWQIYVRQGRRIEGRAIVTQHNFTPDPKTDQTPRVEHPIALGTYSFDVHPCQDRRFSVDGFLEGVFWFGRNVEKPSRPGQIAWEAMLPKKLNNLLVPVGLSSTHMGMAVVRMEPVWMTTGQISGLAAAVAKEKNMDVANLDPAPFPGMLKIPIDPDI